MNDKPPDTHKQAVKDAIMPGIRKFQDYCIQSYQRQGLVVSEAVLTFLGEWYFETITCASMIDLVMSGLAEIRWNGEEKCPEIRIRDMGMEIAVTMFDDEEE